MKNIESRRRSVKKLPASSRPQTLILRSASSGRSCTENPEILTPEEALQSPRYIQRPPSCLPPPTESRRSIIYPVRGVELLHIPQLDSCPSTSTHLFFRPFFIQSVLDSSKRKICPHLSAHCSRPCSFPGFGHRRVKPYPNRISRLLLPHHPTASLIFFPPLPVNIQHRFSLGRGVTL